jgi:hypothetical protein
MPSKARNTAIEQLELFRPPPRRTLWSDLPEPVKQEVRQLVAQMFIGHTNAEPADKVEGGGNDD